MMFSPFGRKLLLTLHVGVSVGWLGAVLAYLVLDLTVARGADPATLRAAYIGMELIALGAILPLAVATVITGLLIALGTKWGLFRHYWVVISLILTTLAVAVLWLETLTIRHHADVAADPAASDAQVAQLGNTLLHSIGALVTLAVVMVLNVFKPRGLTRYGWRRQQAELGSTKVP